MKTILAVLSLVLLAAQPGSSAPDPASSRPTDPDEVIRLVHDANQALTAWVADFQQRRHYVHFDQTDTKSGRITFKRGTGLRLDIDKPDDEIVIVERKRALQWRPKIGQLHIYNFDGDGIASDSLPVPLPLAGEDWDPKRDYTVRIIDSPDPEVVLELVPKSESNYRKKTIWFDPETWQPVKLQLEETTDDVVHFVFSGAVLNGEVDDQLFVFAVPEGAEVVEHQDLPKLGP